MGRVSWVHAALVTGKMGQTLHLKVKKTLFKVLHDPDIGGYEVCWCGLFRS
jgi:hypothetical protein